MSNQQEQQKQQQSFEPGLFLPGGHNTDPPLPESSPTTGYKLNHFMLRIRDPSRSLHFYTTLLGMRTVFTMNAGPFTLYYLGYPPTPSDRADLPAWAARTSEFHTLTQTPPAGTVPRARLREERRGRRGGDLEWEHTASSWIRAFGGYGSRCGWCG